MLFNCAVGLSLGESCGVAAVCVMTGAGMHEAAMLAAGMLERGCDDAAAATAAASSRSLITVTADGRPSISFSAHQHQLTTTVTRKPSLEVTPANLELTTILSQYNHG